MEALGVATAGGLLDVSEEALVTLRAGLSAEQVGRASRLSINSWPPPPRPFLPPPEPSARPLPHHRSELLLAGLPQ
jgi:hypothetical protein